MILLDTNVLSALMRQRPDTEVINWLDRQARTSVWTTSVTVLEIRIGLQVMATGKRRSLLMANFERLLAELIQQRIATLGSLISCLDTRSGTNIAVVFWLFERQSCLRVRRSGDPNGS
jgi:predicted nucleic acid-binding protein